MNRRELLKAMVSMPIVTALGCSTFSSKPTLCLCLSRNGFDGALADSEHRLEAP
jgi:hypothetical protein